jgi:hypothetical protein
MSTKQLILPFALALSFLAGAGLEYVTRRASRS